MKALFNEATETNLATALIDQMALAWLTDRMTGGNLEAALEVFERPGTREAAKTEFDALSDEERRELVGAIMPDINEAVSEAIKRLWHACYRLGFDPEDLDPEHVVLVAMTLIGAPASHEAE